MKKLEKSYWISADQEHVFEALTEPIYIRQWSGDEAVMNKKVGGTFSLWGGSIHGWNKEVSQARIVQDWKEKDWEKYSQVVFNLNEANGQTHLELIHTNIPDHSLQSLDEGWDKYYLKPLKTFLES